MQVALSLFFLVNSSVCRKIATMRIVFCGTGKPAVPVLASLIESSHEVACVVTPPPRRAGRGMHIRKSPAGELAECNGIDILESQSCGETRYD